MYSVKDLLTLVAVYLLCIAIYLLAWALYLF